MVDCQLKILEFWLSILMLLTDRGMLASHRKNLNCSLPDSFLQQGERAEIGWLSDFLFLLSPREKFFIQFIFQ